VPLDPGLRARVVASLGGGAAASAADTAARSWLVDAIPAGLSGRGWSWYPDGFPVQPPGAVRRVADVVADAWALAAAEAAAFAAEAARTQARPSRRMPPLAAAALLGVPLLVTGLVLSGVVPTGAGAPRTPGGSGGLGVVVAEGTGARTPGASGAAGTAGATGAGATGGAGTPGGSTVGASGTSRGAVATGTAGGAGVTPDGSTPATQPGVVDPVGSAGSDPSGTPAGPSSTTSAAGSPTREPASAPVADGASVSPGTVRTPGGSDCTPLRTTVTVPVGDSDGMSGSVTWSSGRGTQRAPLVAGGGALTASVGPFQRAGTATLTITVTNDGGSDTVTRTVEVVACGHRDD
jgi:hypothetical protein